MRRLACHKWDSTLAQLTSHGTITDGNLLGAMSLVPPHLDAPAWSPHRSPRLRTRPSAQRALPFAQGRPPGGAAMIDISAVAFWVLAVLAVGSALAVVLLRNIVHAALFLIAVFGAAAGIYILLNAEFIAIVQVLIYAGAIAVLILFAIMLTQHSMSRNSNPFSGQWWLAGLIATILGGGIRYPVGHSQLIVGSAFSPLPLTSSAGPGGKGVRLRELLHSPLAYNYALPVN